MSRLDSLGEVFVGAIGSTVIFTLLSPLFWSVGLGLGSGMFITDCSFTACMLQMVFGMFMLVVGWWASPWVLVTYPFLIVLYGRGVYSNTTGGRLFCLGGILAFGVVAGIIFRYTVHLSIG